MVWVAGVVVFFIALLINTFRWIRLLAFEKVHLSFSDGYSLSLIGIFFNFVIPGGVGGDVVKCGYLFKRYPSQKWFVGWSTLMDRILGLVAALLYAAIMAVAFHGELGEKLGPPIFLMGVLILVGFFVAIMTINFAPKKQIEALLEKK